MVFSGAHLPSLMCFSLTSPFLVFLLMLLFWCQEVSLFLKYFGFSFALPNQFSTFSVFFSPKSLFWLFYFPLGLLTWPHPCCLSPVRVCLFYTCICLYHWGACLFHPSFLHSITTCSFPSSVLMRLLAFSYPDFCILYCLLAAVKGQVQMPFWQPDCLWWTQNGRKKS